MDKSLSVKILFGMATALLAACSEDWDSPEYQSRSPMFSAMTLKNLEGEDDGVWRAGVPIVATAVQSRTGSLLYKAVYEWTCSSEDVTHKYRSTVVYDNENDNPTDTLTFAQPGSYRLTFRGRYHISGNAEMLNGSEAIPDGTVTYSTPSWMYYDVTVERSVRVVE